ncbi:hypothetical protein LCGC14_0696850, partial [marine sediment metagenome]
LVAFLGSFLGGILVNQGKVEAGSIMKTTGRYVGWRGHDTENTVQNYFILETTTGKVNWYAIEVVTPKASMKNARVKTAVFEFTYKGAPSKQLYGPTAPIH